MDNLSQQYNVMDQFRTVKALTPAALVRLYNTTESIGKMTTATWSLSTGNSGEAFTTRGDLKGWVDFRKSQPELAMYFDFVNKIESAKSVGWDEQFQHKLK